MHKESKIRDPLILGDKSYHDLTRDISRPVLVRQINIGGFYLDYLQH